MRHLMMTLATLSVVSVLFVGCPVTTHGRWQPSKPPAAYTTNVRRRR